MPRSVPSVKSPIPKMRKTAPMTKAIKILLGTGIRLKHRRKTITVIERTDVRDSRTFSTRIVLFCFNRFNFFLSRQYTPLMVLPQIYDLARQILCFSAPQVITSGQALIVYIKYTIWKKSVQPKVFSNFSLIRVFMKLRLKY